jgi:hypothetical protein
MMKTIKAGALAAGIAVCFAMAQAAEAGTLNLTRNTSSVNGYTGSVGGGEFGISNVSPANTFQPATSPMKVTGFDFQSFCVESGQGLSGSQPFNWTINTKVNGTGTALNAATAYLYENFYFGNTFTATGKSMLSDGSGLDSGSASTTHTYSYTYTLGSGRTSSADDLQEAIWWLMGQWQNTFSSLTSNARQLVNIATLQTTTGGAWFNQFGANGIDAVRILTLTDQTGAAQQDILALLPVPLPSSALLGLGLMAGLGAVGVYRRRRNQSLT